MKFLQQTLDKKLMSDLRVRFHCFHPYEDVHVYLTSFLLIVIVLYIRMSRIA